MKHIYIFIIASILSISASAQAWTLQSTVKPGNIYNSFSSSYSFTIGNIAYFYTGDTSTNNFIAYDLGTNTWSNKTKFPGATRRGASGFAISNYGYIAGGSTNDFYQYDPTTNTWTQKANYPDTVSGAYSFAIGSYGYMVSGINTSQSGGRLSSLAVPSRKCYKYDPANNQWTKMNNVPFGGMGFGISGSISGKGYCCTGINGSSSLLALPIDSVWEYNPGSDSWVSKKPYPGDWSAYSAGSGAFGAAYCIVGTSNSSSLFMMDDQASYGTNSNRKTWVFNPAANTWTYAYAGYPPNNLNFASACQDNYSMGFSINNKVLVGYSTAGCTTNSNYLYLLDASVYLTITATSPDTICEGNNINVTFNTNVPFGSDNTFSLQFPSGATGNPVSATTGGTYSFPVPSGLTGTKAIIADSFYIVSTNPAASYTASRGKMMVKKGPAAQPFAPVIGLCGGTATTVNIKGTTPNKTGSYPEKYYWASSPGAYGAPDSLLPNHTVGAGTYYFKSYYNPSGCWYYDTITVAAGSYPSIGAVDTAVNNCPGDSVTLGKAPVPGYSYKWAKTTSVAVISTNSTLRASSGSSDKYTLTVTDNSTACSVLYRFTQTKNNTLAQPICLVTVDSTSTHNVITWEKINGSATDSFYLYREITTNNYQIIATIAGDELSEYHDMSANPNATAYRYKLAAKDTCGNRGKISHFHNTMHLQYLGTGNLIWRAYLVDSEATPVTNYDVYKDALNDGNWTLMLSVPGSQTTATDVSYASNPSARYRVQAILLRSCTPSREVSTVVSNIIGQALVTGLNDGRYTPNIYPNPAKDQLTVESPLLQNNAITVIVYNMSGQEVTIPYKQQDGRLVFSTGTLPAGMYCVKMNIEGQQLNTRFIKSE